MSQRAVTARTVRAYVRGTLREMEAACNAAIRCEELPANLRGDMVEAFHGLIRLDKRLAARKPPRTKT